MTKAANVSSCSISHVSPPSSDTNLWLVILLINTSLPSPRVCFSTLSQYEPSQTTCSTYRPVPLSSGMSCCCTADASPSVINSSIPLSERFRLCVPHPAIVIPIAAAIKSAAAFVMIILLLIISLHIRFIYSVFS